MSLLLRSEKDQEIVSRDKRDRRDDKHICNLPKRMGLYCEIYGKVVVCSNVPLPNYRPDLDDKWTQREVVIPLVLQRRVKGLLQEHLDRVWLNSRKAADNGDSEHLDQVENALMEENADSLLDSSVMEKVFQRRSLRMCNMNIAWEESPEGKKMQDFRKSLPTFKENGRLLQTSY